MALTNVQADQIAALLNERNELTIEYTRQRVLKHADNYLCRYSAAGEVIACVEVKKVQWYQTEILHLTVAASYERQGHAKALLCEAERVARANNARLLQCTIRADNSKSRKLFEGFWFSYISTFLNQTSESNIGVFQKILSNASLSKKVNGWYRLWISVSALLFIIILLNTLRTWPMPDNAVLRNIGNPACKYLLTIPDGFYPDSAPAFGSECGSLESLMYYSRVNIVSAAGYHRYIFNQRARLVLAALGEWLLVVLFLFAAGWSVGWVAVGFRKLRT